MVSDGCWVRIAAVFYCPYLSEENGVHWPERNKVTWGRKRGASSYKNETSTALCFLSSRLNKFSDSWASGLSSEDTELHIVYLIIINKGKIGCLAIWIA